MRKSWLIVGLIFLVALTAVSAVAPAGAASPGWGVQITPGFEPFVNSVATAFHFSPDGSFYEGTDEEFKLKIATTFNVLTPVSGHKIPIDAGCGVNVFLDEVQIEDLVNEHTIVTLPDLATGKHHLVIVNGCGGEPSNWMALVVGKCLWGTDPRNIKFVAAK